MAAARQGLTEYAVVLASLSVAAAVAACAFREPITAFFGNAPPAHASRPSSRPLPQGPR